ncbi:TM2 domain-containing protein [uncultured Ferrimonas sp.]|uniref:TM2 domain-containing protein n=1 Tax=uncultured Ferrimonas sp. TaxID=432640 RepID=UPI0026303741|nr:TM2 domain-containing protein [uncultured Ferrimonas sp.]
MRILEPIEELEQQEEQLRAQVNALSSEQKKAFYQQQGKALKDPDTYAALNWLFLGGVHHFYLGKYRLFFIEIIILLCSGIAILQGYNEAIYMILAVVIYELPQLFFSQKIARQYNLERSTEIYNDIRR